MTSLGRYRVESRIGEGAMADVFRARDPEIGRIVAIKVLKPEYRRDPQIALRFLREARAAGALSHAHIATIYDVGEADGVPYIAMELIEGQSLDRVLETQGRLAYEQVLVLGAQLVDALGYAHARGVVHRDVKPSNILLSPDGRTAKLLDFGVARVAEQAGADHLAKTQVGQVIGTPRYMSPEQALGLPVDARSDLFSLGAVLYEMVTGRIAFAGTGLATLAMQIAHEKVAPIERAAADCPAGLRFVIDKLLAKKPEARFADGAQAHQALQRELAALVGEAPGAKRRGLPLKWKLPLVLVSVTATALLLSVTAVLAQQQAALEHMAAVSGGSITAFVTGNAAVLAADNAGLPVEQQDWAPLQAFVDNAAHDAGVRRLVVADTGGTVRAASDHRLIGTRYVPATGERAIIGGEGATEAAAGFRFVRPIRYAGADFGRVDLVLGRTALDAAVASARTLLLALATVVTLVVLVVAYLSGAAVARPLRRLCVGLDEAAGNGFALRLTHRRRDEFGQAFDAFNRAAAAVEVRLIGVPSVPPPSMTATCIASPDRLAA